VGKIDDTLISAKSATQNLDQTSQQINTTLKSAFAQSRRWIPAPGLFTTNGGGEEVLSAQGRHNIDVAMGQFHGDLQSTAHHRRLLVLRLALGVELLCF
jgi:hypothetical protein